MRRSIKRSLTGLLVVGALAFSAVAADAMGGGNANGPDAYIGIVGAHPGYSYSAGSGYPAYGYSGDGGYQGGGFQANTGLPYQNGHHRHGGYGTYNHGY